VTKLFKSDRMKVSGDSPKKNEGDV